MIRSVGRWTVAHQAGPPSKLHELEIPDVPVASAWILQASRPALVLGSTQSARQVDVARAAALGLEVTSRRSGGSAVIVDPGEMLWIDVIVPASDSQWSDDVGHAFEWLGEVWVDAIDACGVPGAMVHRGPMHRNRWSALVCFAGLGAGEVVIGDAKVVGISQRRTRRAARFQCAALLAWRPVPYVDLLVSADERRAAHAELAEVGLGLSVDGSDLTDAFLTALALR